MNRAIVFQNIGRFILLVAMQILIFNNIYLGGYINPCLYVLFIAMLPTNTGKIPMMLIAFAAGLCVDLSTNMPGFHTFAATAVAFLRGIWFDKIITRDNEEEIVTPSLYSGSYQQFALYLLIILLVYNFIYHSLLVFDLFDIVHILLSTLLSTAVTWILAILYQTLFTRKQKNNEKHSSR